MMKGDRTLPGVAFVAASGRAFLFFKVLLCCYFACFFCLAFFTRKDCYVQNPVICCGDSVKYFSQNGLQGLA